MHNVEKGGSYGLLTYASIIVAVLFSVIWAIVVLVQELKLSKKDVKNKAKKIRQQTDKLRSVLASSQIHHLCH